MGLYLVECPVCKKEHMWFSGSLDQLCENCRPTIVLSNEDFDKLVNEINNPKPPNEALIKAAQLYKEMRKKNGNDST